MAIAIQAGGESSRMGQNKALMPFLGEPLISRVVRRLRPLADELLVTTNSPAEFAFLNLPLAGDLYPGMGSLGGLYTALACIQNDIAAVVACDLPFVNARLLAAQRDLLLESGCDLVIPRSPDGLEPMHCVYRRKICQQAVLAALEQGQRKVTAWFDRVNVRVMGSEEISAYDPEFRSFINLNTPGDFSRAVALAEEWGTLL